MSDLLRAVAALPQFGGALSVSLLGDPGQDGFCLARTDAGSGTAVATAANAARFGEIAGQDAEGYARLLSGAPAMLDLLAVLLLRQDDQLQADAEIDGGDAVEWLAGFTAEAKGVLQAMVGPLAPGKLP